MTRLPSTSARRVLAALERAGFVVIRSRGSHRFLQHRGDATRRTVIAVHSGDLPEGTLRAILKQVRIDPDEFLKLL
jgi:predicted RNA binding protein YcfA (HicA-like mRNA interferase family)